MKYFCYSYSLNTLRGKEEVRGLLLQEDKSYALVHPWTYLGDASLEDHLNDLKTKRALPLTLRALDLLETEKRAKKSGFSLVPTQVPSSYIQIASCDNLPQLLDEGFEFFKIKIAANLEKEKEFLDQLSTFLSYKPFKIRIDCNQLLSPKEARDFFASLSDNLLCAIDYVEDPISGTPEDWANFSKAFDLRVAHDFAPEAHREVSDVWVLKPSRYNPWPLVERAAHDLRRIVVSNAFDHPLGQVVAAVEAAKIAEKHPLLVDACALLGFENFPTSIPLKRVGPYLDLANFKGPGFGMDSYLENLDWVDL